MKIGEIKAQAITLMYPEAVIKMDTEDADNVERAIYELKADHNFEGILEECVGAINRAVAHIESMGLSQLTCTDISAEQGRALQGNRLALTVPTELYRMESIVWSHNGREETVSYTRVENEVLVPKRKGVYTLIYRSRAPRITGTTKDSFELLLPWGVAEALPYFVASDLLLQENEESAKLLRERFESAVSALKQAPLPCSDCFQTIYSME